MSSARKSPDQLDGPPLSDLLAGVAACLRHCHGELRLHQDVVALLTGNSALSPSQIESIQRIDHVTQIHDDLAGLLDAMSEGCRSTEARLAHLPEVVRLDAVKQYVFKRDPHGPAAATDSGDVSFF